MLGLVFSTAPAILMVAAINRPHLLWDALQALAACAAVIGTFFVWLNSRWLDLYRDRVVVTSWYWWSTVVPISSLRQFTVGAGDMTAGEPFEMIRIDYDIGGERRKVIISAKPFRPSDVQRFDQKVREIIDSQK